MFRSVYLRLYFHYLNRKQTSTGITNGGPSGEPKIVHQFREIKKNYLLQLDLVGFRKVLGNRLVEVGNDFLVGRTAK